jgi:phosphoribosylaminoimidazole-succinocarboxamide synthase
MTAPSPATFTDVRLTLPDRREGKVRISYQLDDRHRLMITTDRISAFDRVLGAVPYKGQVLNQLGGFWFRQLEHLSAHHYVKEVDPNAQIVRTAAPLPVEVVVRGYITGVTSTALWGRYAAGDRVLYGHRLPDGLTKNAPLPRPLVTPTTKASDGGHDEPITTAEVVSRGLVSASMWADIHDRAIAIYTAGAEIAARAGLILADTKYEFGIDPETQEVMLIDEVHTPDSSRLWVTSSYEERIQTEAEPESLDKELLRLALADYQHDLDRMPSDLLTAALNATSPRYVRAYEQITGATFCEATYPVEERLTRLIDGGIAALVANSASDPSTDRIIPT